MCYVAVSVSQHYLDIALPLCIAINLGKLALL